MSDNCSSAVWDRVEVLKGEDLDEVLLNQNMI